MASFGSTSAAYKDLPVGVIQVQTVAGDEIPISVLIVPNTETPLQNLVYTSLQNNLYLKGLQLAHPVTDNETLKFWYWMEVTITRVLSKITSFIDLDQLQHNLSLDTCCVDHCLHTLTTPQLVFSHIYTIHQKCIRHWEILEYGGSWNSDHNNKGRSRQGVPKVLLGVKYHLPTR